MSDLRWRDGAADPAVAIHTGATHLVIGRSLARAADPAAVLAELTTELG